MFAVSFHIHLQLVKSTKEAESKAKRIINILSRVNPFVSKGVQKMFAVNRYREISMLAAGINDDVYLLLPERVVWLIERQVVSEVFQCDAAPYLVKKCCAFKLPLKEVPDVLPEQALYFKSDVLKIRRAGELSIVMIFPCTTLRS